MNGKEYMLAEYDKIATAYFGLRDQINEWFKAYVTLVGFPLTILAAILKISGGNTPGFSLFTLPDIVSALLILVALMGFFVTLTIISMRMEMILYARTINLVRRYFGEKHNDIQPFLILPTSDLFPPFYEAGRAMFWQVLLIGLLDSLIAFIGIYNLFRIAMIWAIGIAAVFLVCHWAIYWITAYKRQTNWKTHFPENLTFHNY